MKELALARLPLLTSLLTSMSGAVARCCKFTSWQQSLSYLTMVKISHLTFLITIVLCIGFFSIKLHLRLGETEHYQVNDMM